MISREKYKAVRIHIVTFKKRNRSEDRQTKNMNDEKKHNKNVITCPVCTKLNKTAKTIDDTDKLKKLYSKRCELCLETPKMFNIDEFKHIKPKVTINDNKHSRKLSSKSRSIGIQTQRANSDKNVNLLNEVLTVFQNKKIIEKKTSDTVTRQDVSTITDINQPPKLQIRKVFQFSTDDPFCGPFDKSTIITSHEDIINSKYSIDITKQKSSSIPQMKLEELRNSMKEKSTPKDAIEEVNRMFANVRKRPNNVEDKNRPCTRNGPRILPVVKNEDHVSYSIDRIKSPCRCQSEDFSSGDFFLRPNQCSHEESQKSEKCLYMMCCHHKKCRQKMRTGVTLCQRCREETSGLCNRDKC